MLQHRLKPLAHLGYHLPPPHLAAARIIHVAHIRGVPQPDVLAQGQQVEVAVLRQRRRRVP
jgi:hypothetical protein